MSKKLEDIFNDDEFGLLDSKTQNSIILTDEDRLINAFEEINSFIDKNNREPSTSSMAEYSLHARLDAYRNNERTKSILKTFDRHHLLGEIEEEVKSIDDILDQDAFGLLETDGDDSIFNFKHAPKPGTRAEADYIAQRKPIAERKFKKYEAMFQQVHRELREGKRKIEPFNNAEDNLIEGNFYLVDGLLAYLEVSDAEQVLKENKSGDRIRLEGRTVTVFENGTISNMLFRSLAKAIQKNGSLITQTEEQDAKSLLNNMGAIEDDDVKQGWIYVLKSKSKNPSIANIENLYKIGFSRTPVQERIRNANKSATYLFADVELIARYIVYNIDVQKFENLIHRFFANTCLSIDIFDENNVRIEPREWFVTPIEQINEAIKLIINGNIIHYIYDLENETIVLK